MKIKIKFIGLILIIAVSSCKNYMEVLPQNGLVKDEFWKTKEDVTSVLMGAYTNMAQMDDLFFKYGEIRGDMVTSLRSAPWNETQIMNGNIYSDNSLCDWLRFYQVIDYCNEVISKAPGVRQIDNTFSDFELKSILSEAHYMRDLCYFYLVRIFKDVPLVLIPSESDESNFYPSKTDGDTILNFIVKDLVEYRNYSITTGGYLSIAENKGRVTRGAYDALLADIALWRFDYEGCIDYVNDIVKTDKYHLVEQSAWFTLFYPGNSVESIFELQHDTRNQQGNKTYGLTVRTNYQYGPSQTAVDFFKFSDRTDNSELERTRGERSSIYKFSTTDYFIWKYVGVYPDGVSTREGITNADCGWIMYRYADVLLMKAEAFSQTGRLDSAKQILTNIRKRAGLKSELVIGASAAEYEDAIMEERAKELAFEGKRWFDLMRLGRRNNYARKGTFIGIITENVIASQRRILSTKLNDPMGWYLPIYKTELERNKNLVQNPYYKTTF